MATMNISLPDPMRAEVERRVREGHYANASDYVRALIREDLAGEGSWELDEPTAAALREGEESGISDKTVEQIFAEARAKYLSS